MKLMINWPIDELQDTWQLVSKLHQGQSYGGPGNNERIEYINHLGSVTFEVMNALMRTPQMNARLALCCAMLHDSIEDTAFSYEDVRAQFGAEVANGVMALTKQDTIADQHAKMTDSLHRIKQQPKEVWAVKMADRICNLYAPPYYWSRDKKLSYLEEARLILAELGEGNAYLAGRLKARIEAYHRFL